MRYFALTTLALVISVPALSQWRTFGHETAFRISAVTDSNGKIKYPDFFHKGSNYPTLAARAKVMSRKYPSTETKDFREGGDQYCEPSTNWNRILKWRNGSCVDLNGEGHRFVERRNGWGDVMYFKCDNFGVSVRSLISERHPYAIGNPEYGETVSTRVVVNGREVGTYGGYLPNVFIAGDIRSIPTDQGMTLLDKLKKGSEVDILPDLKDEDSYRAQAWHNAIA